jgi:hypothetical protein
VLQKKEKRKGRREERRKENKERQKEKAAEVLVMVASGRKSRQRLAGDPRLASFQSSPDTDSNPSWPIEGVSYVCGSVCFKFHHFQRSQKIEKGASYLHGKDNR